MFMLFIQLNRYRYLLKFLCSSLHAYSLLFFFLSRLLLRFFFFFQAEDGIRYIGVTGVQTCALPISRGPRAGPGRVRRPVGRGVGTGLVPVPPTGSPARPRRGRRRPAPRRGWSGPAGPPAAARTARPGPARRPGRGAAGRPPARPLQPPDRPPRRPRRAAPPRPGPPRAARKRV